MIDLEALLNYGRQRSHTPVQIKNRAVFGDSNIEEPYGRTTQSNIALNCFEWRGLQLFVMKPLPNPPWPDIMSDKIPEYLRTKKDSTPPAGYPRYQPERYQ